MRIRTKDKNQGFTLVELIVVIVILAILAAILVPALLGYIDKAKKQQDILNAKNCMTAAQTAFVELYAKGTPISSSELKYNDINLCNTAIAKTILETSDDTPYMLIIGTGNYNTYVKTNQAHKAYTVYFVAYWAAKDKDPIFFDGSEWTTTYPWKGSGQNKFSVNGEQVDMQFYFVSAPSNNMSNNWNELKAYLKVNQ